MLISRVTWLSRLRSSKFHYNLNPYKDEVRLGFKVDVYTRSLTYFELNSEREQRLRLISDLSDQGCSNLQISQFLNSLELKTPRGTTYTQKLIWVTLKKYRDRLIRINDTYTVIHPPKFYKIEKEYKNG